MTAAALDHPGVTLTADHLIALRPLARARRGRRVPASDRPGGFVSRRRGRGMEAADIRAYVDGDDIRHLDRNTTARTGKLHVRTFQDEVDRNVLLVADLRPSMLWGTRRALMSVAAAEILTLVGWRAADTGARVGLAAIRADGMTVIPARGRVRGMLDVIGGLVAAHRSAIAHGSRAAEPPLDTHLPQVRRIAPRGSHVALASAFDTPGDSFPAALAALAHRARLDAIVMRDSLPDRLPAGRYAFRTAAGRREQVIGGAAVPAAGAAAGEAALGTLGLHAAVLDTDTPPVAMAAVLDGIDGRG